MSDKEYWVIKYSGKDGIGYVYIDEDGWDACVIEVAETFASLEACQDRIRQFQIDAKAERICWVDSDYYEICPEKVSGDS